MVSCGDDDDEAPSRMELLTAKSWKLTDTKANGQSLLEFIDDCDLDDLLKFESNGTVVFSFGAAKCDPDEPNSLSGTWSFQNNDSEIRVVADGDTSVVKIEELSATTLRISYTDTELGVTINYEETYTAQ